MQKKKLRLLCIILFLLISSCASIPDVPICAEISLSKGICTYTVSGKNITLDDQNTLNGKTWFEIRSNSLKVPADSWKEIKSWMIKQCKKTNQCDKDISSWDRNLNDRVR